MGLLAVKIAQMYAVRSDIIGVEKSLILQSLYEEITPISWPQVEEVLKVHAPVNFWDKVVDIKEEPLATASLGQVHTARLKNDEEVVVKVIKPEAVKDFEKDLNAVRLMAWIAIIFYPKLKRLANPIGTIDTIARLTRQELNLLNESDGANRLRKLIDEAENLSHLKLLKFPKIYLNLSSSKVLVSQRLSVTSVRLGLEQESFTYEHLLRLFRVHGYFLFLKGEFHGDLHPGNIFFDQDQFWFIDNANIETVDVVFSQGLLQFLAKLGEKDYGAAAKAMEGISQRPPKNKKKYYQDFQNLYHEFKEGTTSLTTQMMATVKLCVHSGMEFPEGAFPVIKSLMYLDGMVLKCHPKAKLLEDVLDYLNDKQ